MTLIERDNVFNLELKVSIYVYAGDKEHHRLTAVLIWNGMTCYVRVVYNLSLRLIECKVSQSNSLWLFYWFVTVPFLSRFANSFVKEVWKMR